MPDECDGIMAHVRPFQRGLAVARPMRQTSPIATSHSSRDERWITHVGSESALAGSAKPSVQTPGGRLPSPPRYALCSPRLPPAAAHVAATVTAAAPPMMGRTGEPSELLGGVGFSPPAAE